MPRTRLFWLAPINQYSVNTSLELKSVWNQPETWSFFFPHIATFQDEVVEVPERTRSSKDE